MNHALGIDIGGTTTALGVVTMEGRVLAHRVLATQAEKGFDRAVQRICVAALELIHAAGLTSERLAGAGIGCAGPVDPLRGQINNPFTLSGWDRCDIVRLVTDSLGVPAWLENDADVAAVGEWSHGAGQGAQSLVMLTFGTGVGGAAIIQNQLYRGLDGEHPEIGHVSVSVQGPECYCARRGCLESFASGTAIARAGHLAGFRDASDVFAAAGKGDRAGERILADVRLALDAAIGTVLHTFLPACIVMGGGLVEAHEVFFLAPARAVVARSTQIPRKQISVAPARLGNRAGLIGAARLAMLRASESTTALLNHTRLSTNL